MHTCAGGLSASSGSQTPEHKLRLCVPGASSPNEPANASKDKARPAGDGGGRGWEQGVRGSLVQALGVRVPGYL